MAIRTELGLEITQTLFDVCRPNRMALVVYDMQIGIVRQVKTSREITDRVSRILNVARENAYRVIFMRHMSMPTRLMGAAQFRQAMAWQRVTDPSQVRPWFLRGAPGFELVAELAPRDDEAVLDKITFSAFEGTPLSLILRDCGLSAFAIAGIATEIGIEPTVRHGADLGFVPVVPRDACGAGHAEAGERSLANIAFMGDALLTDTDELCDMMVHGAAGGG
jgi:nicotinamidase-related amidase